jgi:hypothetical protein
MFDRPNGERWRGGQIFADEGANWRARVQAEASMVRDVTFDKSMFLARLLAMRWLSV